MKNVEELKKQVYCTYNYFNDLVSKVEILQ